MAKRFTDTNKYKKPFIRSLPGAYKLLWDYLYHDCDHAGIWIADFEVAQLYVGKDMPIYSDEALILFNKEETRIIVLNGGSRWFILPFIEFQYGELNEKNRAHLSVILILKKWNLWKDGKVLISPFQGGKDKDMDKEKDMDMVKDKDLKAQFEIFRHMYPGTKRGFDAEFENLQKKQKNWRVIVPILTDALQYQINAREQKRQNGGFVPEWKNLQTWMNQKCWEEEIITNNISYEADNRNRKGGATREELRTLIATTETIQ